MKLLIHFCLLFLPVFVFATDNDTIGLGNIKGTVTTMDDHPAAYVSVSLKNAGRETITDANGNFKIKGINPGTTILIVSLFDYTDSEIVVEVKENETVLLKVQLHRTHTQLKEVIVRANIAKYVETKTSESMRLNMPLIEVPQNIVVTTRQLLSDQGLLSMSEAIRTVSGIQKITGGLNDYILIIRGTDAMLNVFRNGVGGYWWNQQEDAAMIEKIEFIKGPAGFMVSLAEPGGMVNTITKQPVKERLANVTAGFGSYNMMRLSADFGGSFNKSGKFSYRFNAGVHNQERIFQFGKALRYFLCPVLKYDFNTKTSVTAEYNYMWGKTSGNNDRVPSLNGKMFALPKDFAVADDKTDELIAADNYYRVQLLHNFDTIWHLNAQIAYVYGTWGGYMLNAGEEPVSNDTLYRFSHFDDTHNFSKMAQVFIDGKFYTGRKIEHQVLAGIDYCNFGYSYAFGSALEEKKFGLYLPQPQYYTNLDSLRNYPIDPPDKADMGWAAFYAQDKIKFAGKLVATIAGHLTHAYFIVNPGIPIPDNQTNTDYNVFTPRVGLSWLFTQDVSVYALYDQCFVPQFAKNFGHKTFLPLTGYNIETGLKSYFFKKMLSLNLSVFNIVKNNTLTADPLHPDYSIQTGQVISKGIDVDITGNITPSLTVNANYEYADAKITKDSDSNRVGLRNFGTPDHCGNLWLKYNLLKGPLRNISFALGYQYMGSRCAALNWEPGEEKKYLPVYNLFDAALSYHNEKFNISLNVYNITNINYATFGYFNSLTNEWRYTPGEPVNFRLTVGLNLVQHKK